MAHEGTRDDGVIINQSPRPRMLILGFAGNEYLIEQLQALVPTSRVISSFSEVRQAEWDLLVTDQPTGNSVYQGSQTHGAALHLGIIYFPANRQYATIEQHKTWSKWIIATDGHVSQELLRLKGLPERIQQLTHEQLEPLVKKRRDHQYFSAAGHWAGGKHNPELTPFIKSAAGQILAGKYRRTDKSEAWLLPFDVPDIIPWAKAALAEWHGLDPERFPGVPDWSHQDEWITATEQSLHSSLRAIGSEREAILQQLAVREAEVRARLGEAREAADAFERALLTGQGDTLVRAVGEALREFGFKVEDGDEVANERDYLEDLRVMDPDESNWVALVEVKGYTKGAKTEALTQFIRFHARHVQRTGKMPDSSWYVVNQFMNRDPSTRQPVLHGKDEDVAAFASAGGLIIDTVILFKLLKRYRMGEVTAEQVRRLLRTSTGRLVIVA
ncbi:hypothetical protein [Micromonospora chersina]|uniref:hypothetical protein n=1 Tax=Micromonospora chersina TaxID=47854 RepID=UPI003D94478D